MLRTGFSLAIFQDFRITHPQMIARTSRAVDMKIKTVSGILSANCLNQLSPTTREAITPKRIAGKAVIKTSLDKRRKIFGGRRSIHLANRYLLAPTVHLVRNISE